MKALDEFYEKQDEPKKSCLLFLRDFILNYNSSLTPEWKYKLPFFYFKGKMFCYFWKDKTNKQIYIGFMKGYLMKHPILRKEKEKRVKKFYIDCQNDLPIETLREVLDEALGLY